ncbi:MAG: hypothetical protein AAFW73_13530 [Bacteroidota bacterium]
MSTNLSTVTVQHYHDSSANKLIVQTTTPTNKANFRAQGMHGDPTVNAQGDLELSVLLNTDPSRAGLPFDTPVVHYLELDTTSLNLSSAFMIHVTAYVEDTLNSSGFRKIGDAIGQSAGADEGTRPIV